MFGRTWVKGKQIDEARAEGCEQLIGRKKGE